MTTEIATPATETPLEPTTPIKPSEAIRLGCLIAPVKGDGEFFPAPGQACALGAMALGFGYDGPQDEGYVYEAYHLVMDRLPTRLPGIDGERVDGLDAVWSRNDDGWSRERIADWLAGLGL